MCANALRASDYLEQPLVNERMILKLILKKYGMKLRVGSNYIGTSGSVFCEDGNFWCFRKAVNFLITSGNLISLLISLHGLSEIDTIMKAIQFNSV